MTASKSIADRIAWVTIAIVVIALIFANQNWLGEHASFIAAAVGALAIGVALIEYFMWRLRREYPRLVGGRKTPPWG